MKKDNNPFAIKFLTVGELIEQLLKFPPDAPVFMYSPYDDPDLGTVNGGGPIQGVRMADSDRYGHVEADQSVELWWEGV
jgi:hypothetical protein